MRHGNHGILTATGQGRRSPGNRFFVFLRSRQANMESHCNVLDRSILEIRFTIQEPITSLVRGQGKRNTGFAENGKNVDNPPPRLNRGDGIDITPRNGYTLSYNDGRLCPQTPAAPTPRTTAALRDSWTYRNASEWSPLSGSR